MNFKKKALNITLLFCIEFATFLYTSEIVYSSEKSTNNRKVIVLFDGLRGRSGKDRGIKKLNRSLQKESASFPHKPFSSQVFQYDETEEAYEYIRSFNDLGALAIVGYSLGGDSAVKLSKDLLLPQNQVVDLLIQIDAASIKVNNNNLPKNVTVGINYYQESTNIREPQGIRQVNGSENINVEDLLSDNTITHGNIDDNIKLIKIITEKISDIEIILNQNRKEKNIEEEIIKEIEKNLELF